MYLALFVQLPQEGDIDIHYLQKRKHKFVCLSAQLFDFGRNDLISLCLHFLKYEMRV